MYWNTEEFVTRFGGTFNALRWEAHLVIITLLHTPLSLSLRPAALLSVVLVAEFHLAVRALFSSPLLLLLSR